MPRSFSKNQNVVIFQRMIIIVAAQIQRNIVYNEKRAHFSVRKLTYTFVAKMSSKRYTFLLKYAYENAFHSTSF